MLVTPVRPIPVRRLSVPVPLTVTAPVPSESAAYAMRSLPLIVVVPV